MSHMSQVEPRITARFPEYRERILQARFRDVRVDELCRDYDAVLDALETEDAGEAAAVQRARNRQQLLRQELLQLARELEQEMLAWLASEEREKGKE